MDGFVTAYSTITRKKQRVPAHFLGHPVLGRNLARSPQERDNASYPDGDPSEDWKSRQLDAYAAAQTPPVDLTGASTKAAKVAAIAAAALTTPQTSDADGAPDQNPA